MLYHLYVYSVFIYQCQVSFQLRRLADKKGGDEERFNQLANTVEAFTYCLLDPLRSDRQLREEFGCFVLDHIIEDAIDLDQKKVFLILNFRSLLVLMLSFYHGSTISYCNMFSYYGGQERTKPVMSCSIYKLT